VKVLFLATRSPWPSTDGGRVLMARTIEGLHARGHAVTVVAPTSGESPVTDSSRDDQLRIIFVPVRPRPLVPSVLRSLMRRDPGSVLRHEHPAVAGAVSALLSREHFDIVHVEQLHALPQAAAAIARGVRVVLRAENVESDLWYQSAASRPWWRFLAESEAGKLARWERQALGRVTVTVALTRKDAERLRRLSPASCIEVVRAPMPAELPSDDRALAGAPPIVLLSSGWFPNRDGVKWFLRDIWPAVFARLPGARLHLFGRADPSAAGAGVVSHPAPDDARHVFVAGSIFVVPLRIASGASMRILEAWARGVPVVATPTAAAGLDVQNGHALALASTPAEFTRAFSTLFESRHAAVRAIAAGREVLREHHDPTRVAGDLDRIYITADEQHDSRHDGRAGPVSP
jgi:glycosyltransferase involved in cell wall biosynthesis